MDCSLRPGALQSGGRLLVLFVGLALMLFVPVTASTASDIEEAARALVVQVASGDLTNATARFNDQMRQALPPEKLGVVWAGLREQMGAYRGTGRVRTEEKGGLRIVHVVTEFENGDFDTRVVFDAAGNIAGLFFAPIEQPAPAWVPPDYVHSDRFADQAMVIESAGFRLPAVLSKPHGQGPFPAAVLVHGSGPHDPDETIGPNKPFRDLAGGLASQGIAVLRYTKRTLVLSQQERPSIAGLTVDSEVVDDALAAIALLRRTPGVDPSRIFVVGHSLGGMLAPRIAARDGRLAGIVLLAANASPLETLALDQVRYIANLDGAVSDSEQAMIDRLGRSVEQIRSPTLADTSIVDFLGTPIPGSYWLDLRTYRPVAAAAALGIPVLVLRGERDYQVSSKDFVDWQVALDGMPNAAFKSYPDLNHLFIAGTGPPRPQEYMNPGHVGPEVVEDIGAWIAHPKKATQGTRSRH